MIVILKAFASLTPFRIPITLQSTLLALLVVDFIYYWKHRTAHQVRLLWAFHSIHHSSKEYNLSTALRLPWFGEALDTLFYVPAVLIGFNPMVLFLGKIIVLLYQYGIHTESVGKLGRLDLVLNTPSNHRVHHGSNAIYLDKNHAGILMVWDHLFGTYQAEREDVPIVYGLVKPLRSYNPFSINFAEFRNMIKEAIRAESPGEAIGFLLYRPGWVPVHSKNSYSSIRSAGRSAFKVALILTFLFPLVSKGELECSGSRLSGLVSDPRISNSGLPVTPTGSGKDLLVGAPTFRQKVRGLFHFEFQSGTATGAIGLLPLYSHLDGKLIPRLGLKMNW
jgi:hypothetical protein